MTDAELIEAVAIEVMGETMPIWWDDVDKTWVADPIEGSEEFNPLTNMNHAFMVVDRMKENNFSCELFIYQHGVTGVRFYKPSEYRWEDNYREHELLGHAICLAALEAVEEKK